MAKRYFYNSESGRTLEITFRTTETVTKLKKLAEEMGITVQSYIRGLVNRHLNWIEREQIERPKPTQLDIGNKIEIE